MTNTSDEEIRNIEHHIIEYLVKMAKSPSIQKKLTCFVCNRKSWDNKHNIQDCVQNVEVSIQGDRKFWVCQGAGETPESLRERN